MSVSEEVGIPACHQDRGEQILKMSNRRGRSRARRRGCHRGRAAHQETGAMDNVKASKTGREMPNGTARGGQGGGPGSSDSVSHVMAESWLFSMATFHSALFGPNTGQDSVSSPALPRKQRPARTATVKGGLSLLNHHCHQKSPLPVDLALGL